MDRAKACLRAVIALTPQVVPAVALASLPVLFLLALLAVSIAAGAAFAGAESSAVSKSLPGSSASTLVTVDGARFSNPPSDQEILVSGILPQPLAPIGGTPDAQENRALAQALIQYQESLGRGAMRDAVNPLTDFLRSHPASRWRAALDLNLGIIYRQTGHMSKALEAWQRAWDLSKNATGSNARAIADYSVGQLAEFEAYLGRMETLAPLLAEVKGRPMHGAGAANISNASQGLAEMRTRPQDAFRCGPMALDRICLLKGHTDGVLELEKSRSTTRGTSLLQVAELAHKIGLNYQMAYREPGAPLIVPAVMHWKVGHFAAIVKRSGDFYQVEDPTFGENIRVSRATLDEEGSGYSVVPAGPLPKGWRPASQQEGESIWGRGNAAILPEATTGTAMAFGKCQGAGAASPPDAYQISYVSNLLIGDSYVNLTNTGTRDGPITTVDAQAATVSLTLHDPVLTYRTPKGPPLSFELFYSHRESRQPAIFTYTNFGPKWTSNWISYFTDNTSSSNTADLYAPGGGLESYVFNGGTSYGPGLNDQALVTAIVSSGKTVGFTRELPDGSVQTFAQRFGTNQFFLSSVADPQGNKVTLTYDGFHRITTITDAAGENATLSYGLVSDVYKVTKVTDPFGRFATFTYNSDGQLASITDTLGITSSYTYLFDSGDFISSLTTPYGISTFTYGDTTTDYRLGTTVFLTITDPLGQTRRVEYHQQAPGIADSDPSNTVPPGMATINQYLSFRNTFVWDAHQLALATLPDGELDYTKARIFHWNHLGSFAISSDVLESVKEPLENRVWYNYPNQGASNRTGSSNLPTAIGRVLDDGTTQLVALQRNSFGKVTQSTDPVGRQLTFNYDTTGIDLLSVFNTTAGANQLIQSAKYNTHHRPLMETNAAGGVTNYTYNAAGQLLNATDPLSKTTTNAYGSTGLLLTITRPFSGAVTTFTYDSANRLSSSTDSEGYKLIFAYDNGNRPVKITFPDSTTITFLYKLLDLAVFKDRLNHETTYTYDALRRTVQRKDPLGRTTTLSYCDCGAISALVDPNANATHFSYDLQSRPVAKISADGTTTKVGYEATTSRVRTVTDALGQTASYSHNKDNTLRSAVYGNAVNPTASASFTWDPGFQRVLTMTDGTGTTFYKYNAISNPPQLGAGLLSTVAGPKGDKAVYTYDVLGRPVSETIDGSPSQFSYDSIGRIISDKNPLDNFSVAYLHATDLPLSVTSVNGPSTVYTYFGNAGDTRLFTITNKSHAGALISSFQLGYDAQSDLTSLIINGQFPAAVTRNMTYDAARQLLSLTPVSGGGNSYGFTYDGAGNRLSETIGAVTKSYTYNSVNALTSPGSAVYDKEGEPLTLGSATYKWDAAHRLISVTSGAKTTRFGYDGFGRRARITQLNGATVTSDKYYFWCRTMPCVEKDAATNAITKRYLTEGVIAGSQFYYARDHLGSIREMVTASGSLGARYDYDPYGARNKLAGAADSDFGFAQLFQDPQSGLELAVFRAYDALSGRWLNRDPIGEAGGSNLYSYVLNNPTILNDPLGLCGLSDSFVSPSLVDAIDSVMRFGGEATASVEQGAGLAAFIFAPEAIRSVETLGLVFTGNGDYEPYDYGSHKSGVHNPVDSIHLNAAGIAISEWSRKTEDSLYRAILDPREYRLSHLKLYPEERPYRPGFHEPGFGGVRQ